MQHAGGPLSICPLLLFALVCTDVTVAVCRAAVMHLAAVMQHPRSRQAGSPFVPFLGQSFELNSPLDCIHSPQSCIGTTHTLLVAHQTVDRARTRSAGSTKRSTKTFTFCDSGMWQARKWAATTRTRFRTGV